MEFLCISGISSTGKTTFTFNCCKDYIYFPFSLLFRITEASKNKKDAIENFNSIKDKLDAPSYFIRYKGYKTIKKYNRRLLERFQGSQDRDHNLSLMLIKKLLDHWDSPGIRIVGEGECFKSKDIRTLISKRCGIVRYVLLNSVNLQHSYNIIKERRGEKFKNKSEEEAIEMLSREQNSLKKMMNGDGKVVDVVYENDIPIIKDRLYREQTLYLGQIF